MLPHDLLLAVLAQIPAAAPDAPAASADWLGLLQGIPFLAVLGLLWRVATWHADTDGRLKSIEAIIFGDGKGNEGCALKHRALDKMLSDAPTRGSVNDAFQQVRALEKTANEDRQRFSVALERMEGAIEHLTQKVEELTAEVRERPLGRTKTNPGFDPSKR